MEFSLDGMEVRVLGCLIEKELSTPEYYPLTINALVNACNQKSNRLPVITVDDATVADAISSLMKKQLVLISAEGGRTQKYRHTLMERLRLTPAELAILAELLLRGPQTIGELRSRTERMHLFPEMTEIEITLNELNDRTPPLVTRLPLMPGHKEQRYAHLFAGQPEITTTDPSRTGGMPTIGSSNYEERITSLANQLAGLQDEVKELRSMIENFKAQFE
jgi:uncharacterized protein YceH (UPF0502 family)